MYTNTRCPQCNEPVDNSDSGEPDYKPGWWCPECQEFFTDDEFNNRAVIAAALPDDTAPATLSIIGLPNGATWIVSAEAATLPDDWRPRPDADGD